jgi:hypothetical protein
MVALVKAMKRQELEIPEGLHNWYSALLEHVAPDFSLWDAALIDAHTVLNHHTDVFGEVIHLWRNNDFPAMGPSVWEACRESGCDLGPYPYEAGNISFERSRPEAPIQPGW